MNDEKQLLKVLEMMIFFKDEYNDFVENLRSKYYRKLKNDIEEIAHNAVADYYKYPSKHYRRSHSLYKAYKIKTNDKDKSVTIHFDGSYLEPYHPGLGEYIYEWMFGGDGHDGGYHGGAVKGEFHPNPGTPWLREPIPFDGNPPMRFIKGDYWLKPADQDKQSPYEIIIKNMDDRISVLSNIAQKEHDDFFNPRWNKIIKEIKKL